MLVQQCCLSLYHLKMQDWTSSSLVHYFQLLLRHIVFCGNVFFLIPWKFFSKMLICRLLLRNVTGCSYLIELSPNPSLLSKAQKFMLTGLLKSSKKNKIKLFSWPKTKSLHLSGTKVQGNLSALILLMTYLTVSNVSQGPSKCYNIK